MSQQRILDTLQNLGFSSLDAQVYLFLGKKGPKKASELVHALKIPKQQLYAILKNLQSRGIINATLEHPARFSSEPFEKILDLFVKSRMEEVQQIQSNKNEILIDWQKIEMEEDKDKPSTFKVLEGNNYIYPKLKQMIEETKTQLLMVITIPELIRINQNEVLEQLFSSISKSKIRSKILTEFSSKNLKMVNILFEKHYGNLEIRTPAFGLRLPNSMVIRDDAEVAFLIDSIENHADKQHTACLWTNCKTLVQSFNSVFENSWRNAIDIQKKKAEIETGKPTPKTCVIVEGKIAKENYDETIRNARSKIMIMTSSKGLIALGKSLAMLRPLIAKGVTVNVMAPIVNENLEVAQQLMRHCEVRHIPEVYLGATVVDGQHFYQFKKPMSDSNNTNSLKHFENTFYTDDFEYAGKMEQMLTDIWSNAHTPSIIAFKSIIQSSLPVKKTVADNIFEEHKKALKKIVGFSYFLEPQQGAIDEKDIIDKITNAIRIPAKDPKRDAIRLYGTQANAVIYPPKNLNLPSFLIIVSHNNSKSSFGSENSMQIFLQMKIAEKESFFSVAFVTDNPRGYRFRKVMQKLRQSNEVAYLLKKDELNVQVHGQKLIAGWTVPIPLLSPKYILPPACIMFEGFGETKTYKSELTGSLRDKLTNEFTMLDAFVTFILPSSRYHGPGSDGILLRERIMISPPLKA